MHPTPNASSRLHPLLLFATQRRCSTAAGFPICRAKKMQPLVFVTHVQDVAARVWSLVVVTTSVHKWKIVALHKLELPDRVGCVALLALKVK